MHVIIIGAGEVGFHMAERLVAEEHDVVIIDKDPDKIIEINKTLDVLTIIGYGSDFDTLHKAGITHCDVIIAATNIDETNMVACFIAKKFDVPFKIARIRHHFSKDKTQSIFTKEELGIDVLINPEDVTTSHILKLITSPASFEIVSFEEEELVIRGFRITEGLDLLSIPIAKIGNIEDLRKMLILAIIRDDKMLVPKGAEYLLPNDKVYIISRTDDFPIIAPYFHESYSPINRIFIIGVSSITRLICEELEETPIHIKVIEEDMSKCVAFSERFRKVDVVNCSYTNKDVLVEEGLSKIDAFIAVSDVEEKNILSAMIAKKEKIPKTIASIQNKDYLPFTSLVGIDAVVIPKKAVVGEILKHMRRGNVLSVVTLGESNAELIEYLIEDSALVGIPLKDIKFPDGCLLAAIIRSEKRIIPRGDDYIKNGDKVIVFLRPNAINKLDKFFG